MNESRIVKELVSMARDLMADDPRGREAGFPYGREGGNVKRAVKRVLKKHGWDDVKIFEARNGSGFNCYANMEIEQLPDISYDSSHRVNDDLRREMDRDVKKLQKELERVLKPKPEEVVARVDLTHTGRPGESQRSGRLYVYLKYEEGFYVTPLEIL